MKIFLFLLNYAFSINFNLWENGGFLVSGDEDDFNLASGAYFIRANNKTYSTTDNTLQITTVKKETGTDVHGIFTKTTLHFNSTEFKSQLLMEASVRHYQTFVIFNQKFDHLEGMSNNDPNSVSTSFPSFEIPKQGKKEMFVINPCDDMAGEQEMVRVPWNEENADKLCGGLKGGPFFIFDKTNSSAGHFSQVFTISSFSKFTAVNSEIEILPLRSTLSFGLPGSLENISNYEIETILHFGNEGFYESVHAWGDVLLKQYGKTRAYRESELTVNYLSYWTDQARPDAFPDSMQGLYYNTSLPVIAHNRWWCSNTTYAKENGGGYDFSIDRKTGFALPTEYQFWDDLFRNSTRWGLRVYLQDWMGVATSKLPVLEKDLSIGKKQDENKTFGKFLERNWLLQMSQAAEANGISILYCMAFSRHMLQSVELQNVVSIRSSGDYEPGNRQWDISISAIYTHALGLAPFKDTFWTTPKQPGHPGYENITEWHPELESAMATLSTGIVGISDRVGYTNDDLVSKSIRPDGKILKPSRPIACPDHLLWELNPWEVNNGTSEFETYSELNGHRWGIILLYKNVTEKTVHRSHNLRNFHFTRSGKGDKFLLTENFEKSEGRKIDHEFEHFLAPSEKLKMMYFAPLILIPGRSQSYVTILGEINKWVKVSPQRFSELLVTHTMLSVTLSGVDQESIWVGIQLELDGQSTFTEYFSCKFGPSGKNKLVFNFDQTFSCNQI
ncbi:Oidioi.mRNA.OKI2018_I69.chr2.g5182.t1.cds [Oikopleura dioica]|uniref:Oidioi.mRNA.OKI2018_I69.chr2.g5182.t1.cds n=1 Tax=Oikopleura dioica TaxID=34765 RepID=A0ABN7T3Y3_OIKDI|nr:Oidioi.mRNA.OKI2018_I69.chr2.g5182.t1.cds [Oikopleura dioica]